MWAVQAVTHRNQCDGLSSVWGVTHTSSLLAHSCDFSAQTSSRIEMTRTLIFPRDNWARVWPCPDNDFQQSGSESQYQQIINMEWLLFGCVHTAGRSGPNQIFFLPCDSDLGVFPDSTNHRIWSFQFWLWSNIRNVSDLKWMSAPLFYRFILMIGCCDF